MTSDCQHCHEMPSNYGVPDDFPELPFEGALSGAQTKFSVSRNDQGSYSVSGWAQKDRQRTFEYCVELVAWGETFLLEKSRKEKYLHLSKDRLLEMFFGNLHEDIRLPPALARWVIRRVARRLDWAADPHLQDKM